MTAKCVLLALTSPLLRNDVIIVPGGNILTRGGIQGEGVTNDHDDYDGTLARSVANKSPGDIPSDRLRGIICTGRQF